VRAEDIPRPQKEVGSAAERAGKPDYCNPVETRNDMPVVAKHIHALRIHVILCGQSRGDPG
jgi:hypothetical protein